MGVHMTFAQSITTCFTKYADFKGRAVRSEFWWFWLFQLIVAGAAYFWFDQAVYALVILGFLLPYLAVAVRRLHDTGRSGWYLLVGLIPLIGVFILLAWMVGDGHPLANEYGPPPKGPATTVQ
jgi:uncharacterized membrane protein YhaH (DUF805 family)